MTPYFKWFAFIVALLILVLVAPHAHGATTADVDAYSNEEPTNVDSMPLHPSKNIPTTPPHSATVVFICTPLPELLLVVFTYPDGTVVRFSSKDMHGFDDAEELLDYVKSAVDIEVVTSHCIKHTEENN